MVIHGRGFADNASTTPITEDTVFRVGSVTKLFTAIAVMQLVEQGRVDLDAPADDYLARLQADRRGTWLVPRHAAPPPDPQPVNILIGWRPRARHGTLLDASTSIRSNRSLTQATRVSRGAWSRRHRHHPR